jgi:SAM-dependent methyltransferase
MTRRDDEAAARLRAYFGERLARYGHDPRGVDWQSGEAQRARFDAVLAIGSLDGATLLDAGCGLGDLYGYLRARGVTIRYAGCDLSSAHVTAARQAYPGTRFVVADVREVLAAERFDYVIACGLLHLRVPRWNRWAWDLVRAMYANCGRGLALTLPHRGAGHPPVLAAVDPADWLERLRRLCPAAEAHPLVEWGDTVYLLRKGC